MQKSYNEASPQNVEYDDVQSGRISFENLRSFYRELCEEEMSKISLSPSFQSESPGDYTFPPRRAADSSSIPTEVEIEEPERNVVVIVTYSRMPCEDFRRSMEGLVAARVESGEEVHREFLEELLFRYLELNNDNFFGDIMRAFLELIGVWHRIQCGDGGGGTSDLAKEAQAGYEIHA
ncbi:hypothetical protein SASPL_120478 [Salvia splendens]|uniref:Transcription repressor n=1 Tax=Salvia splendens TaxID=180675 RepID=A0A8X8ZU04_SALSN|nr:hypothetical protein SASPL_120478 [Salvia splendens]